MAHLQQNSPATSRFRRTSSTLSSRPARSGRKPSSRPAASFEDLAAAIAADSEWIVTSDYPSGSTAGPAADNDHDVTLVFDGGSIGNPGRGYGSFTYKGRVVRWPTRVTFPGITTNNQAEYQALIAGLRAVHFDACSLGISPGELRIEIRSDSQLVVYHVNGTWKVKNAALHGLHRQTLDLLNPFAGWDLIWHPRSESVRILGH